MSLTLAPPRRQPLYCSFCGKVEHEVLVLVAGPTVFICNECVDLCVDIVREKMAEKIAPTVSA